MRGRVLACAVILAMLAGNAVHAASLRVSPVSLVLKNGMSTSSVRVWNDDREPLNVQVRIFRSVMQNGREVLTPTQDVVVSPPMATLAPGTANVIRVVRLSQQSVTGRESYRLVVDQLPSLAPPQSGTVSILVRHVIPVSFQ